MLTYLQSDDPSSLSIQIESKPPEVESVKNSDERGGHDFMGKIHVL